MTSMSDRYRHLREEIASRTTEADGILGSLPSEFGFSDPHEFCEAVRDAVRELGMTPPPPHLPSAISRHRKARSAPAGDLQPSPLVPAADAGTGWDAETVELVQDLAPRFNDEKVASLTGLSANQVAELRSELEIPPHDPAAGDSSVIA